MDLDDWMRKFINKHRLDFISTLSTTLFAEGFPDLHHHQREQIRHRQAQESSFHANSILLDAIMKIDNFHKKFIRFCQKHECHDQLVCIMQKGLTAYKRKYPPQRSSMKSLPPVGASSLLLQQQLLVTFRSKETEENREECEGSNEHNNEHRNEYVHENVSEDDERTFQTGVKSSSSAELDMLHTASQQNDIGLTSSSDNIEENLDKEICKKSGGIKMKTVDDFTAPSNDNTERERGSHSECKRKVNLNIAAYIDRKEDTVEIFHSERSDLGDMEGNKTVTEVESLKEYHEFSAYLTPHVDRKEDMSNTDDSVESVESFYLASSDLDDIEGNNTDTEIESLKKSPELNEIEKKDRNNASVQQQQSQPVFPDTSDNISSSNSHDTFPKTASVEELYTNVISAKPTFVMSGAKVSGAQCQEDLDRNIENGSTLKETDEELKNDEFSGCKVNSSCFSTDIKELSHCLPEDKSQPEKMKKTSFQYDSEDTDVKQYTHVFPNSLEFENFEDSANSQSFNLHLSEGQEICANSEFEESFIDLRLSVENEYQNPVSEPFDIFYQNSNISIAGSSNQNSFTVSQVQNGGLSVNDSLQTSNTTSLQNSRENVAASRITNFEFLRLIAPYFPEFNFRI